MVVAAVPWARPGSRFTAAFEDTAAWLVCHATLAVVAMLLRVELVEHPVPVSVGALRALQSSPLQLDIYTWLTHRASYATGRSNIKWSQLRAQFGSNTADTRQGRAKFREMFSRNLAYVLVVYPDAKNQR